MSVTPRWHWACLFLFLHLFKRTSSEEIPLGVPVGRLSVSSGASQPDGDGTSHRPRYEERVGNGEPDSEVISVEVLNQLVKENPQNMTHAIRAWLERGNAAPK